MNTKHNEELAEILKPTLQQKEASKTKGFGKKMKSCAQAIGIERAQSFKSNEPKKKLKKVETLETKNQCQKEVEGLKAIVEDLKD